MVLGVIPARFASTRFPGKPLVEIEGKSMIQRVYEQARLAEMVQQLVVATDDERIFHHVQDFGGTVVMTDPGHPSGTDRCAEVAQHYPEARLVLNIQGDEPFLQPAQINLLAATLLHQDQFPIATLAKRIESADDLHSPHVVKVVFSQENGTALYFSRHPVPFVRGIPREDWLLHQAFYKHIGLYAFRREALMQIAQLAPTPLEKAESLEQLRWLEHGLTIAIGLTQLETTGIDTPDDLERLAKRQQS